MLTQSFVLDVKCYMGLHASRRTEMDSKKKISTSIHMVEILGAIKVDGKDTIRWLEEDALVADPLRLSHSETLLVQLPAQGMSHISTVVGCVLIQV